MGRYIRGQLRQPEQRTEPGECDGRRRKSQASPRSRGAARLPAFLQAAWRVGRAGIPALPPAPALRAQLAAAKLGNPSAKGGGRRDPPWTVAPVSGQLRGAGRGGAGVSLSCLFCLARRSVRRSQCKPRRAASLVQWFLTVQQFSSIIVKCLGPLDPGGPGIRRGGEREQRTAEPSAAQVGGQPPPARG